MEVIFAGRRGTAVKLEMRNNIDSLEEALDALDSWIEEEGGSPRLTFAARLVMEELATNIIKYGYDDALEHTIRIEFDSGPPASMRIEDDGHAFDPVRDAPEPDLSGDAAERPIGGLGLHMVRTMTQSMRYSRERDLNRLAVTFPD
jgi:anti-sigma regulatory factor (Ser/Thr protein kinase)